MRRIRTLAMLPLAVLILGGLGGCFEMEETLVLRKDGTGTMTMKAVIDLKKVEQVKQMLEGMFGGEGGGGMEGAPVSEEDFDLKKVKEQVEKVEGLKLLKAEEINDAEAGKRGFLAVVEFKNLEALAKAGLWEGDRVLLQPAEDGAWTLEVRRVPQEAIDQASGDEAAQMMPMIEGMFGPLVEGLKMSSTWVLPGAVVKSNGKADAEGHIVWSSGFKDMLSNPGSMNRLVTFKAEGLDLKAFEHKSDAAEKALEGAGMGGADDDDADEAEEAEETEEEEVPVPSGR
ncbi:MAG: hypothetical protein R3F05_06660 [Planctomycetota bacterium]